MPLKNNLKKASGFLLILSIFCVFGMASRASGITAEVKNYLGSPTIMIDGKPQTPLILFAHPNGKRGPKDKEGWMENQIRLASKAGVHLFSTYLFIPWPKPGEKPDFKETDSAVDAMIEIDPKILIMPRIYPVPPKWWIKDHPGDMTVFNDGKLKEPVASVASEAWLSESITHMRVLIRHLEDKYGDHFIAYQPENGEWFHHQTGRKGTYGGFEEPFRAGFAAWVKKKYQTEEQLRQAWHQPEVKFATIRVPTVAERTHPDLGLIYDPATQQFQIDFAEYQNFVISETIITMAHAIKEETQRKKLTMFFYGYYFEMGGMHHSGHMGLGRVLRSPDVDILSAPLSYDNREPGGCIPMMSPVDAIREAGKISLTEDDTRTYLLSEISIAQSNPDWLQKTPELTMRSHRRQFGHLLPRRLASWYMDLQNEGWVNGEDIWANIAEMKKIYDREMQRPTPWNPEVAVVADERSSFYIQFTDADLFYPYRSRLLGLPQLMRMGTNFRILLLEDVLAGRCKLPKVTMFVNCQHLTPENRDNLQRQLAGKTAVWFWGSGYLDDKHASPLNMTQLTGFTFTESRRYEPSEIRFDSASPLVQGLARMDYAPSRPEISPRWSIKPERKIRTFAHFNDGSIAAAEIEKKNGGRSYYIGTLSCPATVLRNILKESGVHLYIDSNDVLATDGRFVGLTASTTGPKTILVPKGMNLYREGNATPLAVKDGKFTESFDLGEVRFYRLEKTD